MSVKVKYTGTHKITLQQSDITYEFSPGDEQEILFVPDLPDFVEVSNKKGDDK